MLGSAAGSTSGSAADGCDGSGHETPSDQRTGLDPINPILGSDVQIQNPVNQGVYKSHYVLFMLGFSTWF